MREIVEDKAPTLETCDVRMRRCGSSLAASVREPIQQGGEDDVAVDDPGIMREFSGIRFDDIAQIFTTASSSRFEPSRYACSSRSASSIRSDRKPQVRADPQAAFLGVRFQQKYRDVRTQEPAMVKHTLPGSSLLNSRFVTSSRAGRASSIDSTTRVPRRTLNPSSRT